MSRNVKRDGLSNSNGDSVENSAEKMPEEKPKRASRKKSEKAAQENSPEGIAVKAEEDKPKRTRKTQKEPLGTTPQELTSKEPIETTQGVPTSEGTTQQPPSEEPTPEEPKRVLKKSRVWEIQSYIKDVDGNEIFTPEKRLSHIFCVMQGSGHSPDG